MDPERWRLADKIFEAALEVDPDERMRFLDQACQGDSELYAMVLELLEADAHAGSFLEDPVARIRDLAEEALPETGAGGQSQVPLPERIGSFRIVDLLGQGGMGIVYLAEQTKPVQRRVALKVVLASRHDRRGMLRFEAERQALAKLSHPNVARMFEAGATSDGHPYFAMELVDGPTICRFCDENRLPVRQRLELFEAICDGVQHAHEKGILHRDLKPSNVLVAREGGRPVPKVIDFGLAKAIDRPLVEATQLTGDRVIGTPAYLSPEAIKSDLDVDTRSDVFSLGILLYELLVGVRPFETRGESVLQVLRRVSEEEPTAPSERLITLAAGTKRIVAERRGLEPGTLQRQVDRDLDLIVLKAIAKDRAERYRSPAELAADLMRYLCNEPVLASPPTAAYRIGKFIRRHRLAVVAASLVLLALIAGTVGTSVGLVRARRAEASSRREAEKARRVLDFMVDLFRISDPITGSQPDAQKRESITARELLDRGAEKLADGLTEEPAIRAELMSTVGQIYHFLGLYDNAEQLAEQALALQRETLGEEHTAVATSLYNLASLRMDQGDYSSAEMLYRQVLAMRRRLLGEEHVDVAEALNDLGVILMYTGDYEQAEPLMREAMIMYHRLLGEHHWVALAKTNLATVLKSRGDYAGADKQLSEALTLFQETLGNEHSYVTTAMSNLASLRKVSGDLAGAEELFRKALALRRQQLGAEHPLVAACLSDLASVLQARGNYLEAEPLYREALASISTDVVPIAFQGLRPGIKWITCLPAVRKLPRISDLNMSVDV